MPTVRTLPSLWLWEELASPVEGHIMLCTVTISSLRSSYTVLQKKNHYIFSSQLRADQMPGPPREGQLMCTLFSKHASINRATPMMSSCHMKRIMASP